MSMLWAIASTLSGTRKKERNCPTSVAERSRCSRKSSRATRLTRQCLPTFRHGRRPSRHQRHTVVSLTPISAATSSALSNSLLQRSPHVLLILILATRSVHPSAPHAPPFEIFLFILLASSR